MGRNEVAVISIIGVVLAIVTSIFIQMALPSPESMTLDAVKHVADDLHGKGMISEPSYSTLNTLYIEGKIIIAISSALTILGSIVLLLRKLQH